MARNGSGTYSLPAGNPVVTNTTISSTWANNTLSDIGTALTQSIAKDGQTVPTANLPMGGFKHTGLAAGTAAGDSVRYEQAALLAGATFTGYINEARGTVAMHATTMDLWAQPNIIDGTGSSVTITAIANAPQAGARRTLYPITGTVITNGATFAVDGGANYTTLAGDALEFEAVTTSTYKVHIKPKLVLPIALGGTGTSAIPAFSAYQSAAQSVAHATFTKVSLQTEEFDTDSAFDSTTNYRFTPQVAGYYQVSGAVRLALSSNQLFSTIYKNGLEHKRGVEGGAIANALLTSTVSSLIYLNGTTDYIELFCYQASGGAVNTSNALTNTYFQAHLARAA